MDSDYGPGDAPGSYGSDYGPGDAPGDYEAANLGLDIGTPGTSTAPSEISLEQGQSLQGAIAQALFDRLSQIDYTTPEGMARGRFGLDSMAALGLGRTEGLNPNNPTQSVDEMRNAQNVANFLEKAVPALVGLIPNYGIVSTIGRVGAGLMSGTMTPAQALTAGIAGALGAKTGIPGPVFEGILSGDFGRAAGAGVQGGLTSLANNLTGSPLGGLALNLSGIGPAVGRSVSEAVSGGTGGSRSGGLGAALGLSSAPSQGSSPTGNTYGDSATESISATLAAIEQAAQQPQQPAWEQQMVAGRYGPLVQYDYGA